MVFLFVSWVISGNIKKHEELMKELIPYYRKFKGLKSYRYFSHWAGQGLSPWGGRLEIFEFENLAALESFFNSFTSDKEAREILERAMSLADPTTVRFSLVFEKHRELWFEQK
jgi:hypothetical protein